MHYRRWIPRPIDLGLGHRRKPELTALTGLLKAHGRRIRYQPSWIQETPHRHINGNAKE